MKQLQKENQRLKGQVEYEKTKGIESATQIGDYMLDQLQEMRHNIDNEKSKTYKLEIENSKLQNKLEQQINRTFDMNKAFDLM